jgi:hypothetical protein
MNINLQEAVLTTDYFAMVDFIGAGKRLLLSWIKYNFCAIGINRRWEAPPTIGMVIVWERAGCFTTDQIARGKSFIGAGKRLLLLVWL